MKTIYTYPVDLENVQDIPLPPDSTVAGIVMNGDTPSIVVQVDGEPDWSKARAARFKVVQSGEAVDGNCRYVASFVVRKPLHIFEVMN